MIQKYNVPIVDLDGDEEIKLFPIRCMHCHALLMMADISRGALEVKCRCGGFTTVLKGKGYEKDLPQN